MPHFQLSSGSCNRGEFCALAALWQRGPRCGSVRSVKSSFACRLLCASRGRAVRNCSFGEVGYERGTRHRNCAASARPLQPSARALSASAPGGFPLHFASSGTSHGRSVCPRAVALDQRLGLHFFAPSFRPGEIAIGWTLSSDRIVCLLSDTAAKRSRFKSPLASTMARGAPREVVSPPLAATETAGSRCAVALLSNSLIGPSEPQRAFLRGAEQTRRNSCVSLARKTTRSSDIHAILPRHVGIVWVTGQTLSG